MDEPDLTTADRRRLRSRLHKQRDDAGRHLSVLRGSMGELQAARSDTSADDEHDPEGPTMSQEWSSLSGLVADAEAQLGAFETAVARMHAGRYGTCTRCGNTIGAARLDARPAAELCIDCARLLD